MNKLLLTLCFVPLTFFGQTPIWYDDCSDASTWVFTNTSTLGIDWAIWTDPQLYPGASSSGVVPVAMETASNGFLFICSDLDGGTVDGDGTTIIAEATNANPIDLSNYPNVELTFQSAFRWWRDTRVVRVSPDNGVTWIEVDEISNEQSYTYPNQASDNPHLSKYDISAAVGGQSQVLVQFYYNDNDYWAWFWPIDDVAISEIPDNRIEVSEEVIGGWWVDYANYTGIGLNRIRGLDYTYTPLSQLSNHPFSFEALVENTGILSQQNVYLNYNVTGPSLTSSGSSSPTLLNSQDSSFMAALPTFGDPSTALGNYSVDIWAQSDSTFSAPITKNFEVTNYIYGKDLGESNRSSRIVGGPNDQWHFTTRYEMYANEQLHGLRVYIDAQSSPGAEIKAVIYEIDTTAGSVSNVFLDESDPYTIMAQDLDNWVDIPFASTVILNNGYAYECGVAGFQHPTDQSFIGTSGESLYNGEHRLFDINGLNGSSNGTPTWYYVTETPMVRMNFDPSLTASPPVPCQANFSYIQNGPTVIFTDLSTINPAWSTNYSATWQWDFGDGNTSTQQNPTHTYSANGFYAPCLTVTYFDSTTINWCTSVYCDSIFFNGLPVSWDCDAGGGCFDPGTGNGQYTTLTDCQNACIQNSSSCSFIADPSQLSETVIGTTTYDLQTNAAVQNRIIVHNDGTISAAWTMSQQFNTTWSDRGTGYNFFNGSTWGAQPTSRLESSRGGWPSIIALGNGGECAITHNTDNSNVNNTSRPTIGTGPWTENTVTPDYLIWNRSASGGLGGNTIHMIGVTASTNFGGLPFNGVDGALVYYRSQDGGITWNITNMQLPGMDSSMYYAMNGDAYAIAAQGNTVVVAYFDAWGDSYIVKSTDNGDTWNKTIFLDFPVDKYAIDDGIDLDGDSTLDQLYSTDNYGSLILDSNGDAHVFYGIMRYADDDLSDGMSSWFPSTNGIAYWNESFGPDTTSANINSGNVSLWYSNMMDDHIITQAPDLNFDGIVSGIDDNGGYAIYYASRSSMPNAGLDSLGNIWMSFSGYTETVDNGVQVFRHIYIVKSTDGGNTWSCPVDITPHDMWAGMQECVFGSMSPIVDDKIRILYQKDFEPGLNVTGDLDLVDINEIVYLEVDTIGLFNFSSQTVFGCTDPVAINYNPAATVDDGSCIPLTYGCTDPNAINYNPAATVDNGSCIPFIYGCTDPNAINYDLMANIDDGSCNYCDINNIITINNPSTLSSCDGLAITNSSSSNTITSYMWYEAVGGLVVSNSNFALNLCNNVYVLLVSDDQGCVAIDTITVGLPPVNGCIDPVAYNYDPGANVDDGSCLYCDLSNSLIVVQNTTGNCDGLIIANAVSSNGTVTYLWNNGNTTNNLVGLCSGIYSVVLTDAVGCVVSDTVNIGVVNGCTDPTAINYDPNATLDDGSCISCDLSATIFGYDNGCGGDAYVSVNVSGGTPPYSYAWLDSNQQVYATYPVLNSYNIFETTTFTCLVSDANGCDTLVSITIPLNCDGCTDPLAINYNWAAINDDGSCIYLTTCAEVAPTGLFTNNVIHNRATINWDNMNSNLCFVDQYRIRYRETGATSWSQKTMSGPVGSCNYASQKTDKLILNLLANTTYEYQMKAWYCGGGASLWTILDTFTTLINCPNVGNLTAYGATPTKATFTWDASNGVYAFVRLKARVDSISNPTGADFFQIGGAGVSYGTYTKNKNGLIPGETYRGQARTYCSSVGGWKSPTWTPLVYWTQPTPRIELGNAITHLDVYPNPSKGIFNITFTSERVQDLRVRVLNVVGEEIVKEELQQYIGEYTKQINLKDNAKGIYFLEIETNDGIINKKLILQ